MSGFVVVRRPPSGPAEPRLNHDCDQLFAAPPAVWIDRLALGVRAGFKASIDLAEPRPHHTTWSELLQRVFEVDALRCPKCGGRMRVLSTVTDPTFEPLVDALCITGVDHAQTALRRGGGQRRIWKPPRRERASRRLRGPMLRVGIPRPSPGAAWMPSEDVAEAVGRR